LWDFVGDFRRKGNWDDGMADSKRRNITQAKIVAHSSQAAIFSLAMP